VVLVRTCAANAGVHNYICSDHHMSHYMSHHMSHHISHPTHELRYIVSPHVSLHTCETCSEGHVVRGAQLYM